ncbi:MAG: thioredoxin [Clostridia bacterium]|nr:thioredoxin [Clostridia bacterium]
MMELKLNSENFEKEVLNSDKPVLVDFYADWCGPCKMMAPIIGEIAEELQGKAKVGKINVDENQELAMKYEVMSIPTLIIYKNGKEAKRFVGVRDKKELLNEF